MKANRVLEILPGNRAIVSTRGLCRVVIQPGNEVFKDLVSIERAELMVETFNDCNTKFRAVVERYKPPTDKPLKSKAAASAKFRSAS